MTCNIPSEFIYLWDLVWNLFDIDSGPESSRYGTITTMEPSTRRRWKIVSGQVVIFCVYEIHKNRDN